MSESHPKPPVAKAQPHPTQIHGQTLPDDYFWLREKDSPEVLAYLHAENAYTEAILAPTAPLQAALYAEMLSHIKETDVSVPYRAGQWFYYSRTAEGSQYPTYCRRPATSPDPDAPFDPTQPEQVFLDVNQLAAGQPYMSIGTLAISPDGNWLAYSTDNTGFRQYTLHIRDLRTLTDQPDTAQRTGSITWAADSETLFYTVEDDATKRQHQLFRHTLGTPQSADVLVYEEPDERFNIGTGKTRDGQYILLEAASHTTSEARFVPAATPTAPFQLVAPRVHDQEYDLDHRNGHFYIRVNDTGDNFRLVKAPVASPDRANWIELISEAPNTPLEEIDLFESFLVTVKRHQGLHHIAIHRFEGDALSPNPTELAFPEPAYTASPDINLEFRSTHLRYAYQSLVSPSSIFDYDTATNTTTLLKQQEVPGNFDRTLYASERIWATAPDGVKVPISLVYRRDTFHKNSTNPLYLYGYGSYGYPLPVGFSPVRLALLDRGIVVAYAHIRGGGDLGDQWHDAGKMMLKRNTFTDFIAAAEHLTAEKYNDAKRIAIEGGSAGGLLMGAVVNLRPDLFRAVLSHVPFVDVMNTMLDATLPLTVAEYEEWGNPNEPEAFAHMRSYSPYDNLETLKDAPVPAMLVKTSLNDSQVMYWEPAKYTAKLRTLKTNNTPLLLHINMDAGHGGASGRYDYLKEIALDYAFLLTQLEVEKV